ncbi:hypothetical protein [Carnobacterium maltaromaticum]|uniref:hypothetical protein n=1 Tax=Carnobacterium maltaromaticum TaxID=2751 RepID=UPI000AA8EC9D|nr:hypothetical protein [Carnobacterium maltaromaticum]
MTTLEKKPINVKVNSELKTEAEKLFNELGLTNDKCYYCIFTTVSIKTKQSLFK